ncbi:Lysosomal Pro-X carboxypeptidase [Phytophthora cinnamomi]|uniref:Lysosomal Pro-X carboxypeptidase n=1 Tax=Phytophthora cinnamomi TaxID=4785 RepID=UPI00355AC7D8|nr:Lysosomal Pro-X carboxypeptidase [Phytophthora cinnamomi]
MGEARPLLARSASSSVGSATSSRRVNINRWQSLNAPQYYEGVYNTLLNYAPAGVVAFGGLALLIGVLVLIHTQHLVATADIPRSSLGTTSPMVQPEVPQIRADASNCSELWFEQRIDHFAWLAAEALDPASADATPSGLPATYKQRYLLNTQFWDPKDKKAPVFFYTGNEGDVTLQDDVNTTLLEALRDAANVFHNATKNLTCFKIPTLWDYDGVWDYQYCTEMLPQETYFSTNGETDMFWPRNTTFEEIRAHCQRDWHTTPDPNGIRVSYGDEMLRSASNIVFSNGLLDPWSSAGVLNAPKDAKVTIVKIAEGAHHLDLFFSHPKDPPSVIAARKTEVKMIHQWINEFVAYK